MRRHSNKGIVRGVLVLLLAVVAGSCAIPAQAGEHDGVAGRKIYFRIEGDGGSARSSLGQTGENTVPTETTVTRRSTTPTVVPTYSAVEYAHVLLRYLTWHFIR